MKVLKTTPGSKWLFEDYKTVLNVAHALGMMQARQGEKWNGLMPEFIKTVRPLLYCERSDASLDLTVYCLWVLHTGGDWKHGSGEGMLGVTETAMAALRSWGEDKMRGVIERSADATK